MRFITDEEVRGTLTIQEASQIIDEAFRALGRGEASNLARSRARAGDVMLSAMGAAVPSRGVVGAKIYSTIQGRFNFVVCLFDSVSGSPLAVMQGNALTELRTCATTMVAARPLANPASRTLAVFGSGIQARAHARAFVNAFPIEQVLVVDPHGCAQQLADELTCGPVNATVVVTAEEAVAEADIVLSATRATDPLFAADAVLPGTFLAAIGSSKPETRELPPELLQRAACVVVESKGQAVAETGDLAEADQWSHRLLELGPLLVGSTTYQRRADDITVYKSVGIGLEDVVIAHAILQRLQK
jgi:ornithine cyclodeaminase